MKKLIKHLLIGFLTGALAGNLISMLATASTDRFYSAALLARMGSAAGAILLQTLLSALIGAASVGGMLLYDTDLPLAAATAIHFAVIIAVYVPVALILGWVSTLTEIAVTAALMLAAFALIWLIRFLSYRRSVRKLNEFKKENKPQEKE